MEVTRQMIADFVQAYTMFGDAGETMERMTKEMSAADVLLGLEHPDCLEMVAKVLEGSAKVRKALAGMEVLLEVLQDRLTVKEGE